VPERADLRLLLVHAHPDDETIGTGATMAHYAAAGARVTLVTCTLGEEGEVLVPQLAQLAADQADQLGGWRIAELYRAMAELGVTDHRFLGGAGRFRDSGMMGTPANQRPRAFWRAAEDDQLFQAAVTALVEVIREVRPQVMVSYDEVGGYGHPDHIMAHRVATAAAAAAARPGHPAGGAPWPVSKFYWTAMPRSAMQRQLAALRNAADQPFELPASVDEISSVVADELVTTVIHAPDQQLAKARALAAHATQVTVAGEFFALSNNRGQQVVGTEYFRLVSGRPGGALDADGRETDLFGGLPV
jgi:N-acetyl-1-D-myo-inositol-2-amino-2-deoxy-alpha-D-glucopyranoside deacetylase